MRWQKIARFAIAIFIVGFASWVFLAMRRPGSIVRPPETLKIDDKAIAQTIGGADWKRRDSAGKVQFSIKSETHKIYEDGRNLFEHATLELPDRDGRTITINSDQAETTKPAEGTTDFAGTVVLRGNVKLRTSDDLTVTCNDASYNAKDGLLTVPGPVTFARGRMTGKGVGATYDRGRDVLWILDQAQVAVTPDPTGGGALQATSGSAGLARADHYIRLAKAAHVVADNRTIDADEITATFTPDDQKIQFMQLRGNSSIVATGAGAQSMAAKNIDLTYGPDGRILQHSTLMEQSVVTLPAQGGGAQRITAKTIEMAMSADGSAVSQLNATENVVLDLPGQGMQPGKTITSSTLAASGEGNAGLQTATFDGPIDYRETRAARGGAAAVDRHATSRRLVVHTKPGFGDLQQAEFRGDFKFVDGAQTTAEAQLGLYQVDQDRLDLSPSPADPGPSPTVTNGSLTVHARTIAVTMGTQVLKADTDVRSIMDRKGQAGGRGAAAPSRSDAPTRMPSLLKQDEPVTIRSNRLEYDGGNSRAVYTGAARLTQPGGTELFADTIEIDDKTGNLTAHGNVRTKMIIEDADPKTKQRTSTETSGTAEHFVYDDAKRLVTYTSTAAPLAHLVGAQGDISGKRIDLFLKPTANELDRVEADGEVTTVEGNRTAKGRHLTYTAADAVYVMTGTPVDVVEKEPNSCKKSVAGKVTFQRAVDRVFTEGSPATTITIPCTSS